MFLGVEGESNRCGSEVKILRTLLPHESAVGVHRRGDEKQVRHVGGGASRHADEILVERHDRCRPACRDHPEPIARQQVYQQHRTEAEEQVKGSVAGGDGAEEGAARLHHVRRQRRVILAAQRQVYLTRTE